MGKRIEEIIAEMRMGSAAGAPFAYIIGRPDKPISQFVGGKTYVPQKFTLEEVTVSQLADRLEKANKQDKEEATTGNIEKLRRVVEYVQANSERIRAENWLDADFLDELDDMCANALSSPTRNCDVGTADEQLSRFLAQYETAHGSAVDKYLLAVLSILSRWAQMPYEEGGTK